MTIEKLNGTGLTALQSSQHTLQVSVSKAQKLKPGWDTVMMVTMQTYMQKMMSDGAPMISAFLLHSSGGHTAGC